MLGFVRLNRKWVLRNTATLYTQPPVGVTSMAAHNMKSLFNDMLEHERTETMATLPPLKISVKV